jgi:hypothetical protein
MGYRGKSEHHARELSAGGDLAQRAGRHAWIRGDHELDGITARWTGVAWSEGDLEGRISHRQSRELLAHGERQAWGSELTCVAQSANVIVKRRVRFLEARSGSSERHLGAYQLITPGARTGSVVEHSGNCSAVLAHQSLNRGETLLNRIE